MLQFWQCACRLAVRGLCGVGESFTAVPHHRTGISPASLCGGRSGLSSARGASRGQIPDRVRGRDAVLLSCRRVGLRRRGSLSRCQQNSRNTRAKQGCAFADSVGVGENHEGSDGTRTRVRIASRVSTGSCGHAAIRSARPVSVVPGFVPGGSVDRVSFEFFAFLRLPVGVLLMWLCPRNRAFPHPLTQNLAQIRRSPTLVRPVTKR